MNSAVSYESATTPICCRRRPALIARINSFQWNCVYAALLLFHVVPASSQSSAAKVPDANPGRPTVATPATLTPVGYVQFENGGLYAAGTRGLVAQFSLNQVTKLAVASRLELLTSWEPFAHSSGDDSNQPGGISLGAQAVVSPGEGLRPTVAASYFHSIYDGAAPDIDIGSAQQSALVLVSLDFRGLHADVNGIFNEQSDSGVRRAQFGQTLSVSHGFGRYTVAGELWHFTQPLTHGNTVGNLWALSYAIQNNLIVDGGFNRGLTSTSTRWEAFAGFTYLLPRRLWKSRGTAKAAQSE